MMYFTGGAEEDEKEPLGVKSLSDIVRFPKYISVFVLFIACSHIFLMEGNFVEFFTQICHLKQQTSFVVKRFFFATTQKNFELIIN